MIHFHPHRRLTITLGAKFRLLPRIGISLAQRVSCKFAYASWIGVYIEYNHLNREWRYLKEKDVVKFLGRDRCDAIWG